MKRRWLAAWVVGLSVGAGAQKPATVHDLASEVYPFLGVDWGGNVFVGATVPFGMIKPGPDMRSVDGKDWHVGYASSGEVLGFSQLHVSGAASKYNNILVMPAMGELAVGEVASPREDEVSHPGYYAATLTRPKVRAELTATRRVGLERYTFRSGGEGHLTLDVQHCASKGTGWEDQRFLGGEVKFVSDREAVGVGRYAGGWNRGGEYRVYFAIVLDKAARGERVWVGNSLTAQKEASLAGDQPLGLSFDFPVHAGEVVQAKVGISFVSEAQARKNIDAEAQGWRFDAVRAAANAAWDKALASIQLRGATAEQRREVYTAIYHTMLMPSDRTGENPDWQSSEPYYDDYYAIWDTFRSSGPLLTLIAPDRQRDMLRSLIDIYRHTGWMPDARSGNANGRTQGGSNADVLIADAWVKGMKGLDYKTAYEAMVKDTEVLPEDAQAEGRGGLRDYNARGYITLADQRSGSRTVEYAYDDFAIAEVACGLGRADDAKKYAARTNNWQNLWDRTLENDGFKGFLRPRNPDGSWADPDLNVRGTWPDFFYEGDLWTYSLYVPQDAKKLIAMAGGPETFVRRLDTLFQHNHFDVTNEPGFLLPVMYNWAGRPDHTAEVLRLYLDKFFSARRSGIPGNDDSGAMSSWFLFESIGFYPNAGQDVYLIGTPSYPEADLSVGEGKVLRVIAENLDPEHVNHFVQSATLNGKPLTRSWFRHSEIANGGELRLRMGSWPTAWGRTEQPPSMSDTDRPFCSALTRR